MAASTPQIGIRSENPKPKTAFAAAVILSLLPPTRDQWTYWKKSGDTDGEKRPKTKSGQLTDKRLLKMWADEDIVLALKPGKRVRYLVIDIDRQSPYRNPVTIQKIKDIFARRHIYLQTFESSESGGIHLLTIFDRPVLLTTVIKFAAPLLSHNGYNVFGGVLEVYPSESTKNKPVRVPFQKGFRPLSDDLVPIADYGTPTERERQFIWFADYRCTQASQANFRPPSTKAIHRQNRNVDPERYDLGQYYYENGLDGPSRRHEALQYIGYYLCSNKIGPEDRIRIMTRWMRERHNDYSKDWLIHPQRVIDEIERLAWHGFDNKSSGKGKPYTERNLREAARIENAIIIAVDVLRRQGGLFKKNGTLNRAAVARAAEIDPRTAKQYLPLIESRARKPRFVQYSPA